ncbi:MAG TPA: PTO1314 family radical SAM protein [Nitrososphaerales archaeon]|nr:PTO1314 family radical SAM protein [Nitrososphaerales archaeon]
MTTLKSVLLRGAKRKIQTLGGEKRPLIAGHKLLYKCNLECGMCPFWRRPDEELLTLKEEIKIMDSLAKAGVLIYGFEGGEPLLRRDLPQILAESHERFYTSLVTNGWLLKERIREIGEHLEYLFVSLDGIGSLHDELRGIKGSFDRATNGIKAARDYGTRVAINSTITRQNIHQVEEMIHLAENLSVGINFQPAYDYSTADKLSPYGEKLLSILLKLLELKKSGAPIVNSREYLSTIIESWYHGVPWRCKPWLTINIDPQGRIVLPCYTLQEYNRDNDKSGHAHHAWDTDIVKLWGSYDWEQYESCNKCALSCYLEPSLFSWAKPSMVKDRIVDSIVSSSGIGF